MLDAGGELRASGLELVGKGSRLLRYAMLSTNGSQYVPERLIAEIYELCSQLSHGAAWAFERTLDTGLVLAAALDRRAVVQDEPNLPGRLCPAAADANAARF